MNLKEEIAKECAERHAEFKELADNLCDMNLPNATPNQRQFILDCVLAGAGAAIGGLKRFNEKLKEKSRLATPEEIKDIQSQLKIT